MFTIIWRYDVTSSPLPSFCADGAICSKLLFRRIFFSKIKPNCLTNRAPWSYSCIIKAFNVNLIWGWTSPFMNSFIPAVVKRHFKSLSGQRLTILFRFVSEKGGIWYCSLRSQLVYLICISVCYWTCDVNPDITHKKEHLKHINI